MKMGTYGIYEDEFKKVDGQWFIAKRNVLNEFIKARTSGPNNPVRDADANASAPISRSSRWRRRPRPPRRRHAPGCSGPRCGP